MWENWEKLLDGITVIKWAVICTAVSMWGLSFYFLLKEMPKWWRSFNKKNKKKKPFTLEQMNKDLAASTRPRKEDWDG